MLLNLCIIIIPFFCLVLIDALNVREGVWRYEEKERKPEGYTVAESKERKRNGKKQLFVL